MTTRSATLAWSRLFACVVLVLAIAPRSIQAQGHPAAASPVITGTGIGSGPFDLDISVRDVRGNVVESTAVLRLTSAASSLTKLNVTSSAQGTTPARFHQLSMGEYEVEVTCPGFRQTREHLAFDVGYSGVPIYIYLVPESDPSKPVGSRPAVVLPPQLRPEMEHGMEALRKGKYAAAQKTFTKMLPKSHDNPDVLYNLGQCELGLQHTDLARSNFQRALAGDPNHELALVALAQMELRNGAPAAAVPLLEKAVATGRASWRTDFDLASAYMKVNRFSEAESAASRAARLAQSQSAAPTYLLGEIQYAAGRRSDAKSTWQSMLKNFRSDPLAAQASQQLAELDFTNVAAPSPSDAKLPALAPELAPTVVEEREWAPPDVDSVIPDVAPDVTCNTETVLDTALTRMRSQLLDFEKFSATEHVEHQDIDRYGWPGATSARDFSYIVFVHPLGNDSLFVEESRDGGPSVSGFADTFSTTTLISVGVNLLQPYYRNRFTYSCEGLAHVRGLAAWQVHFVQKPDATDGIRSWKDSKKTWDIPLKGCLWISSTNFSVLRVETDLREAMKELQLTRDHLLVDYGPVNFADGTKQLWLPWKADMYVELRGKRYHHTHTLSSYHLFAVDTLEKITTPEERPE